jgi:SAM-dependent methyltransferase
VNVEPFEHYMPDYEAWFEQYTSVYESELQAVRALLPIHGVGMEIGVGTGRFAAPLGLTIGIEPAKAMQKVAQERGLHVLAGVAEALPFHAACVDVALMVTTLCFLDDVELAFGEAYRIIKPGGCFLNGFVDRDSFLGHIYQQHQHEHVFYAVARFFSVAEVLSLMEKAGFQNVSCTQTIFKNLDAITGVEPVKPGSGEGAFVVVKGMKPIQ